MTLCSTEILSTVVDMSLYKFEIYFDTISDFCNIEGLLNHLERVRTHLTTEPSVMGSIATSLKSHLFIIYDVEVFTTFISSHTDKKIS